MIAIECATLCSRLACDVGGAAVSRRFGGVKRAGPKPRPKSLRLQRRSMLRAAADAGVGRLGRADVEAGIGRIARRRLAVLDVLQEIHRLIAHFEGTLADLAGRQALLHQVDLHRQRVGDDERERAGGDLVLELRRDLLVGVRQELREAAGRA